MAGPHVAGVVGLFLSSTRRSGTRDAIENHSSSAVPRTTTQTCGGVPGTQIPNNTYGWGRIDALNAVNPCRAPTWP